LVCPSIPATLYVAPPHTTFGIKIGSLALIITDITSPTLARVESALDDMMQYVAFGGCVSMVTLHDDTALVIGVLLPALPLMSVYPNEQDSAPFTSDAFTV